MRTPALRLKQALALSVICALLLACGSCGKVRIPGFATAENPIDELIIYADRTIGYIDSGVDVTIALYDEGKISNAQAQQYNKILKRSALAWNKGYTAIKTARQLTQGRMTVSSATNATIEGAIATLKSDLIALTPSAEMGSEALQRITTFLSPLRAAVSGLENTLGKLKLKVLGAPGATTEVVLTPKQIADFTALDRKAETVNQEVQAWIVP